MIADGRMLRGSVGLNCVMFEDGVPSHVETHYLAGDHRGNLLKLSVSSDEKFVDDLTGQKLDPALCRAARKLEMDYVREKGLWMKRTVK